MSKISDAQARAIGEKYGKSDKDFTTASKNIAEDILMQFCNEGIKLMQKQITSKARTGQASTLARNIYQKPVQVRPQAISIQTVTTSDYWDFVDKGVKGVYNKAKAPGSKYSFRNLGTPKKMIESFKEYIARTGSKSMKGKTLIRKNKKKQANIIEQQARAMAVATKIGGIKPMRFVAKAVNQKRTTELGRAIGKSMARGIAKSIVIKIK